MPPTPSLAAGASRRSCSAIAAGVCSRMAGPAQRTRCSACGALARAQLRVRKALPRPQPLPAPLSGRAHAAGRQPGPCAAPPQQPAAAVQGRRERACNRALHLNCHVRIGLGPRAACLRAQRRPAPTRGGLQQQRVGLQRPAATGGWPRPGQRPVPAAARPCGRAPRHRAAAGGAAPYRQPQGRRAALARAPPHGQRPWHLLAPAGAAPRARGPRRSRPAPAGALRRTQGAGRRPTAAVAGPRRRGGAAATAPSAAPTRCRPEPTLSAAPSRRCSARSLRYLCRRRGCTGSADASPGMRACALCSGCGAGCMHM